MAGLQFLVSLLVVCLGVLQREILSIKSVFISVDKKNLILEVISLVLLVGVV